MEHERDFRRLRAGRSRSQNQRRCERVRPDLWSWHRRVGLHGNFRFGYECREARTPDPDKATAAEPMIFHRPDLPSKRIRKISFGTRAHFNRRPIPPQVPLSEAPRDIDGLLFAAAPGDRHGLRGAARHMGLFRRGEDRRKSMGPIPGDGICIGVLDIAWRGLRGIYHGFDIRRPLVEAPYPRPEAPYPRREGPDIVSPVMPERSGRRPVGMHRGNPPARPRAGGPGECLVRGKHKRNRAERRDQRPIRSIRHGTHQFVGCWATLQQTLGRAFRARKRIIKY